VREVERRASRSLRRERRRVDSIPASEGDWEGGVGEDGGGVDEGVLRTWRRAGGMYGAFVRRGVDGGACGAGVGVGSGVAALGVGGLLDESALVDGEREREAKAASRLVGCAAQNCI
jgi:hypothetical protein